MVNSTLYNNEDIPKKYTNNILSQQKQLLISDRKSKVVEIVKIHQDQSAREPLAPITSQLPENARKTYDLEPVLGVADIVLSIFIITPLVVLSWKGLWTLMDLYPGYFLYLPSFILGMAIHITLAISQDGLHQVVIEAKKHWTLHILYHFLRRLYTYIFLCATVMHWRGSWTLQDEVFRVKLREDGRVEPKSTLNILIACAIAFCILLYMKSLRNATAPPFAVALDKGNYVFRFPTLFQSKTNHNVFLRFLDSTVSVALVGNLVTIFWRGAWILLDILFPQSMSFRWYCWTLMISGWIFVVLVFRQQNLMKRLCAKYTGCARVIIAQSYILFSIVTTLFLWGGVWGLSSVYILPDDVFLSAILCHVVSFALLVVMGCSNSSLVRGVFQDGKEDDGECVVFPCHFLRIVLLENEGKDGL